MEITLALLKPHVVRHSIVYQNLKSLIKENFTILHSKEVVITKQLSELFYAEHRGKFFYNRLVTFMSSGPCYALILQSEDCIAKWRAYMGPTKVYKTVHTHPETIRGIYGLSDTRNVCHGSDSEESAMREISILFPELNKDAVVRKKLYYLPLFLINLVISCFKRMQPDIELKCCHIKFLRKVNHC